LWWRQARQKASTGGQVKQKEEKMTDAQIFQIIGGAYAAAGLGIIVNTDFYEKLTDGFMDNPAVVFVSAIMVSILGFLLVTFHNVWVTDWPVIITVFGYLALIKGIIMLAFPRAYIAISKKIEKKIRHLRFYAVLIFIIGLGLMYLGFVK